MELTVIHEFRCKDGPVLPFSDVLYPVSDDKAVIEIRCSGSAAPQLEASGKEGVGQFETAGEGWWRLDLGKQHLAENRRLGRLVLRFKVPKATELRLYVIPERLLRPVDVQRMVTQVEAEIRRPVTWRRADPLNGAAWSAPQGSVDVIPGERLDRVVQELTTALQVRRHPFVEPAWRYELPENAIVSHWATRRLRDLSRWREDVLSSLRVVTARIIERKSAGREQELRTAQAALSLLLLRTEGLRGRVGGMVREWDLGLPIPTGPLVQRDHRLRRLLRAFVPEQSLRLCEAPADLSTYPPVLLNHLFELWGAVWIVGVLREEGFEGAAECWGGDQVRGVTWRLTRGDDRVTLYFEPEPVLLDLAQTPPAHERQLPAVQWAAEQLRLDAERSFYSSRTQHTPDYILSIESAGRRVLLVGDASLADPQYQEGRKLKTVAQYAESIWWRPEPGVHVPVNALGGFVLLPGPHKHWTELEQTDKARDVTVLAPEVDGAESTANNRLRALILRFVAPRVARQETAA